MSGKSTVKISKIDKDQSQIDKGQSQIDKKSTDYICEHCDIIFSFKHNLKRHYKACKDKVQHDVEQSKETIIKRLKDEKDKIAKEKDKLAEKYKKIIKEKDEINKENISYIKQITLKLANNKGSTVNIDNSINVNKMNLNYIRENYTDAYNYEELMDADFTDEERDYIIENGPVAGTFNLIVRRCITNIVKELRPIHCVDAAREKFIVKSEDMWEADCRAEEILKVAFALMHKIYKIPTGNESIRKRDKRLKNLAL